MIFEGRLLHMKLQKLLVFGLALTTVAGVASAKTLPADQWYWVHSDADYTTRVNVPSINYDVNTDTADFQAAAVNPNTGLTDVVNYKLDFAKNTLYAYQKDVYPNNSENVQSTSNANGAGQVIQPNTAGAALETVVGNIVNRDYQLKNKPDIAITPAEAQQKKVEDAKIAATWQNAQAKSAVEAQKTDVIIEKTDTEAQQPKK